MDKWRIPVIIHSGLIAIILIGGAFLFVKTEQTANTNSKFVCAFGNAIGAQPITQNHAETDQEFRQRVQATERFVNAIHSELAGCSGPTQLRISPQAKATLKGVDAGNGNRTPSGQRGPRRRPHSTPQTPQNAASRPVTPSPLPDLKSNVCSLTGRLSEPCPLH